MITLCTLFNKVYLDKGLVLFESLKQVSSSFQLYVLAMDDITYKVLSDQNEPSLIPIKLQDFENDELLKAKSNRKFGEYCWTCSSWLISYILDTYQSEYCTYIDADMCFYSDPSVIIDEMKEKNASVQVISHHFADLISEQASIPVGKYCVEFNTFKNDANGRMLLDIWKKQVLEDCSINKEKGICGDQKYLDNWVSDYPFVMETENVGAGLGPWNICQYKWHPKENSPKFVVSRWGKKGPLVFVHFENITYQDESKAYTPFVYSWKANKKFINSLYVPYLQKLKHIKVKLKSQYGVDVLIKVHPNNENVEKNNRASFLKSLYNTFFVDRRAWHSLKVNLLINIPHKFYGHYSIINF